MSKIFYPVTPEDVVGVSDSSKVLYVPKADHDTFGIVKPGEDFKINEVDDSLELAEDYLTEEEADGRYPLKEDVYTKEESDGRYPLKGDVYTKEQSDGKFATIENTYTKDEVDEGFASLTKDQKLTGANTFDKPVKIADAVNIDEAISKGQLEGYTYSKVEIEENFALKATFSPLW